MFANTLARRSRRSLQAAGRPHAAVALEQNLGLVRDAVVGPSRAVEATLKLTDIGDRHVLAAAANGGATALVTSNLRHFDPAEAAALGIAHRGQTTTDCRAVPRSFGSRPWYGSLTRRSGSEWV